MKVGIIGATGYGGAELIRLLQSHSEVDELILYSSSKAGTAIQDSFPHLQRLPQQRLEEIDPPTLGRELDAVMMATPAGISSELTPRLLEEGLRVIDLSGDFRIADAPTYEAWYQKKAAPHEWRQESIYGLTEWARPAIKEARLLANPGCFPTAALLGLLPLVSRSLIDEDAIIVDGKTGVSGAGAKLSAATQFSEANENTKIYKVGRHQHTPEIEQELANWCDNPPAITFAPHLVPMTRGIMTTIYAKAKTRTTKEKLQETFQKCYENMPFTIVRSPGFFPATKDVYGSNQCDIGVNYEERTGRITVVAVIDNLVKGAAGQAIQNLNIMMGFAETTGLELLPVFPDRKSVV